MITDNKIQFVTDPEVKEAAHRIAKMVVPLAKRRREIAHLIAAIADIPRLGNQLHLREHRVRVNRVKQRRILAITRRPADHRR